MPHRPNKISRPVAAIKSHIYALFYSAYANDLWLSLFTAQMRLFQIARTLCDTPFALQHKLALSRILSLFAHMTIIYDWAFFGSYAALQHNTPPLYRTKLFTRPFWAAHMMSRGRPLFCTRIQLHPFAAHGCSLQEVGLLYNTCDSKVVLNLPTAHMPSLQHTITLCKHKIPLSTQVTFARHGLPLQHNRRQAWFG